MDGDYTSNMSRLVSIPVSPNTMLLIHFTASRTHSHFPRRGQGSMRYDCACRIPGPSFGIVGHSSCRKAAVELQLQLLQGHFNVSVTFRVDPGLTSCRTNHSSTSHAGLALIEMFTHYQYHSRYLFFWWRKPVGLRIVSVRSSLSIRTVMGWCWREVPIPSGRTLLQRR